MVWWYGDEYPLIQELQMNLNEFIDIIAERTRPLSPADEGAWIILVRGQRVRMPSGKMVWKSRGAASSALGNAVKYNLEEKIRKSSRREDDYRWAEEEYHRLMKEAKDKNIIEIKQM